MNKSIGLLACVLLGGLAETASAQIQLTKIGEYRTGLFNQIASEIPAFDTRSKRIFTVNGADNTIDVIDAQDPANLEILFSIDMSAFGANPTSVAARKGLIAVAMVANVKTDPGRVVFFDSDGELLSWVYVGALPDMLTFTPNGKKLLVANEGEPNNSYTIDPLGTVSIIDVDKSALSTSNTNRITQSDVTTVNFNAFNGTVLDPSVRIFGPNATVAQDLEPEYITVSANSKTAWVTLQENNAIAVLDIESKTFTAIHGLGFKNHNLPGNGLDASDQDGGQIHITNWPVFGMYQPDSIASYEVGGQTYLVMANEGDAREYSALTEERRINSLTLDPTVFPNATALKANSAMGRLNVTNTLGDIDGDGDYDALYCFGARSFSIRSASGALIFDSGDQLEQITATAFPANFNCNNDSNTIDNRSDNKGPEPEGVAVGKVNGRWYAFIGLERIGGIMVYNISNPASPMFVQYINTRNFSGVPSQDTAGDLGPEGIQFVPRGSSGYPKDLLVVSYEISGSTAVFEIE